MPSFERDADPDEWVTRRYTKRLRGEDRTVYEVPALYLQKGPVRLLLDPMNDDVVAAEAVADLYLMPAYDPTVSVFHENGSWVLYHNPSPDINMPPPTDNHMPPRPITKPSP